MAYNEANINPLNTGDFSFALSLATNHGCKRVLATSYDSEDTVYQKYPLAKQHVDHLRSISSSAQSGEQQSPSVLPSDNLKRKRSQDSETESDDDKKETPNGNDKNKRPRQEGDQNGSANQPEKDSLPPSKTQQNHSRQPRLEEPKVLFSIDARKLGTPFGGGKTVRTGFPLITSSHNKGKGKPFASSSTPKGKKDQEAPGQKTGGPWDVICFNFPHTGGLSTDVNRQVRANQELLVSFFKTCVPLLSPLPDSQETDDGDDDDDFDYFDDENTYGDSEDEGGLDESDDNSKHHRQSAKPRRRTEPGQILVTLFEGEPYTLWNIRDLARHAGLRVVTSFRFPWSSYPGYSHARTLGQIESKDGQKGGGGWKGEDREARTYIFERKEYEGRETVGKKRKSKNIGRDSDESD